MPRQIRVEVRPVVVEVAAEERGHQQRDDGRRPPKSRQLLHEPRVRLIVAVAVHREVRALDAEHRGGLRGNRLLPRQSFAEHHRLPGEHDRRPLWIHNRAGASNAVAGRIDRVLDRAAAHDAAADARWSQHPA